MCNFEPWKDNSLKLKDIYPIGSVIFLTQPLGNKIVWELPSQGPYELAVEWEDMIWELINATPTSFLSNPQSVGASITKVHTIRNVFVWYQRNAIGRPWTAKLFSDEAPSSADPLATIGTFTGENEHTLTYEEMPVHSHGLNKNVPYGMPYNDVNGTRCGNSGSGPLFQESYNPFSVQNAGGLNGTTQPHNNKERAYNCFIYRRIQ